MRLCKVVTIVLSVLVNFALRAEEPNKIPDKVSSQPVVTPIATFGNASDRGWLQGEYLLWWLRGAALPPLVTTGATAGGGVLGADGTQILFGDSRANDNMRQGVRVAAGWWLDCEHTWAVEGSFFVLEGQGSGFAADGNAYPVVARPFFNTFLGQQDAQAVSFPGVLAGSVTVDASSSNLFGADALVRRNLCCSQHCCSRTTIDALAGYRFLGLNEGLGVQENLTVLAPIDGTQVGTQFLIHDSFRTYNQFHGAVLGLEGRVIEGAWTFNLLGKLGLGCTSSKVKIDGSTTVTAPGAAPVVSSGGLLALSSNIGQYAGSTFSIVPELDAGVGYRISNNLTFGVHYSILYWTKVARPGAQIDTSVNSQLLPPPSSGGDERPAFNFNRSTLWAQGLSLGFRFDF